MGVNGLGLVAIYLYNLLIQFIITFILMAYRSFCRYLMVECEDDGTPPTNNNPSKTSHKDMYSAVIRRLLTELRLMGPKGETMCTELAGSVPWQTARRLSNSMSYMCLLKKRVLGVSYVVCHLFCLPQG